ncbi:MAG: phosphate ABC transporter permease subunit PstC [Bacteroidetes bacterium SB0662_bin_6]|nr:phosphate ABC transporter permease subunit PstC [Bacteroidetes bacterium SB0668_bin_1]MYE04084.1 phosphate ABC transporter permease subunit PstC [Bacteroidetes bacterium SB0662_bin_6]
MTGSQHVSKGSFARMHGGEDLSVNLFRSPKERAVEYALGFCTLLSALTTLGIAAVLIFESLNFFAEVSIIEFLTETRWTPQFTEKHFGIWPLLSGTLLITVIAALVALPIGLMSAIFIAEYAPSRVRKVLKPGLELLAGIPTVVYGYFALTFMTPLLQNFIPGLNIYNALSAGIVVGVMIIPMVSSLSEDAIRAVPRSLAEGAYALGATRIEVVLRVMVPGAISGIMASFILALSRAVGETMIVTLAAGAMPNLTANPTESVQTMTAFIVNVSLGDTPQGTVEFYSLFAVGLVLFLMTLSMNFLANLIIRKYRERY